MRRSDIGLAGTAMVVGALVIGGCGGGSDQPNIASVQSVPTTSALPAVPTTPQKAPPGKSSKGKGSTKPPAKGASRTEKGVQKALEQLPASQRAKAASQAARLVFIQLGIHSAKITTKPDGSAVQAVIGAKEACAGSASTQSTATSRIRKAVPTIQSVKVTVAGSHDSLADYVSHNCRAVELPGGKGPVVLTQKGSGTDTTRSFTVRSKRWTVEYVNGGPFLNVITMKGSAPYPKGIVVVIKRGPGRKVLKGAGTFRLKVSGTDTWTVRVRDGA